MVMGYWSVAILFWQLSIDHIVNVQCKRCGLGKTCLRHPSLPFDSLPYPTRTIRRRVRTYVCTYAQSITWQPKEKRLTIIYGYGALSVCSSIKLRKSFLEFLSKAAQNRNFKTYNMIWIRLCKFSDEKQLFVEIISNAIWFPFSITFQPILFLFWFN